MMHTVLAVLLLFTTFNTHAFEIKDMSDYQPTYPSDPPVRFNVEDYPQVVVEKGEFAVVSYGQSELCPGGGFYLVNTKRKTYQPIDAGTCSPGVKSTITPAVRNKRNVNTHLLTFWVGNDIAARYPLYDY